MFRMDAVSPVILQGSVRFRKNASVSTRFIPLSNVQYTTNMTVTTDVGTFLVEIKGKGVTPSMKVIDEALDFGIVAVGNGEKKILSFTNTCKRAYIVDIVNENPVFTLSSK